MMWEDIRLGFRRWPLPAALAWLDIRNRYRGSVLGPLWLTLSTGVTFAALGLLYSVLFQLKLGDYLPFLAVSLVLWNMLALTVADGCSMFVSAEGIIRQMPLPYSVHVLRCMLRNIIVAAHSVPLVLVVLVASAGLPGPVALLALPGLALLAVCGFAVLVVLGMLCARFRDIGQIIASAMQLAFFLTPVFWQPEMLGARAWLLALNPFYVMIEIVRGPLLGHAPGLVTWATAGGLALVSLGGGLAFFARFRGRIAFWV